jgi:hypothetical protein
MIFFHYSLNSAYVTKLGVRWGSLRVKKKKKLIIALFHTVCLSVCLSVSSYLLPFCLSNRHTISYYPSICLFVSLIPYSLKLSHTFSNCLTVSYRLSVSLSHSVCMSLYHIVSVCLSVS